MHSIINLIHQVMIKKNIIDLSHSINDQMSVYPGTEGPEIRQIASCKQDGYCEYQYSFSSHTGTHIDAPAHILEKGKKLHEYSIHNFTGKAICIPVDKGKNIDDTLILKHKRVMSKVDFILFNTGHSKFWGQKEYYIDYPTFTEKACQLLATFNVKGIGMDVCSPDPLHSQDLTAHKVLMKYQILLIENLTNLKVLEGKEFIFYGIPLPMQNPDGSPVRAFATFENK